MRITVVLGSNRDGRRSHKPAEYIQHVLTSHGQEVTYLDLKELNLPVFSGSADQRELESYKTLMEAAKNSDGVIFVYPEYNHNVCPVLTNALNFFENRELMHKPVGLVSTSMGLGGPRASFVARGSFPTLGCVIVPTVVDVMNLDETFPTGDDCANPKIKGFLDMMISQVLVYAKHLHEVQHELGPGGTIFANVGSLK